ncbi:hypothetical protein CUMW_231800 [Citrus unshiu]|nr:hypothetical protein CUMW_231800 [Citrus unshiu]
MSVFKRDVYAYLPEKWPEKMKLAFGCGSGGHRTSSSNNKCTEPTIHLAHDWNEISARALRRSTHNWGQSDCARRRYNSNSKRIRTDNVRRFSSSNFVWWYEHHEQLEKQLLKYPEHCELFASMGGGLPEGDGRIRSLGSGSDIHKRFAGLSSGWF